MRRRRASITARGIALVRALETARPADRRICNDPLARPLIGSRLYLLGRMLAPYARRRSPGVADYLAARTRYIDDYLAARLRAGIRQLVILGAGFDSRAYRFTDLRGRVEVFEVDHPATQQDKVSRLERVLGHRPDYVAFVPLDLEYEGLEKLLEAGYDPQLLTSFIAEGLVPYLLPDSVDRALEFVLRHSRSGSSIVFDYVYASTLRPAGRRLEIARVGRVGEPVVFGIEQGTVQRFLEQRGFVGAGDVTAEDLRDAYFEGRNRDRPIAQAYAIAHADVP